MRAPLRYKVQFSASERYASLVQEAVALLRHRIPDGDFGKVHELAMEALVEKLRRERLAEAPHSHTRISSPEVLPAPDASTASIASTADHAPSLPAGGNPAKLTAPRSRYVPAGVRRAVWARDEARCTFVDPRDVRCRETRGLEIHHRHPYARGGANTFDNLALLCRAHNAFLAETDFGAEHIEQRIERRRTPNDSTRLPRAG